MASLAPQSTRTAFPRCARRLSTLGSQSNGQAPSPQQLKSGGGSHRTRTKPSAAAVPKTLLFLHHRPSDANGEEQWRRRWRQRPAFAVSNGGFPAGGEEACQEPLRPHRYVRASLPLAHAASFALVDGEEQVQSAVLWIQDRGIVIP